MMKETQLDPGRSLYKQIKEAIKDQITKGELKDGDRVPSERELCALFGVSRITVRQAINEAVQEGFLYTLQGKGTFIASNSELKINQGLVRVTSFSDTMQSRGLTAQTKILSYGIQQADFALSKILDIQITQEVLNMNLLGIANKQVMVFYESYFEAGLGKKMLERARDMAAEEAAFSSTDLYSHMDVSPAFVDQTFEAITADKDMAKLMDIHEGYPLFLISSIMYTRDDSPLEYRKSFYRADKYKFHIKRQV